MELCSIEDAFPDISKKINTGSGFPKPGCTDAKASREERRAARKKKKQQQAIKDISIPATAAPASAQPKEPEPSADTDPDRPGLKRLGEVSALMSYDAAFPDISGIPRSAFRVNVAEATAALEDEDGPDAPATKETFKMPTLPSARCLFTDQGLPDYFGKGLDDADEIKEKFADYSASAYDNPGYKLIPQTLDASFEAAANAVAISKTLPVPSVNDVWKPLTPAGARTAYFQELPAPGGQIRERVEPELPEQKQVVVPSQAATRAAPVSGENGISDVTRDQLMRRIQELTDRLNQLEKTQQPRNSQQEVLIFVGVGLFTLLTFDMAMRFTHK